MAGKITSRAVIETLLDMLCEGWQNSHKCVGCPFLRDVRGVSTDRVCSLELMKAYLEPLFDEEE